MKRFHFFIVICAIVVTNAMVISRVKQAHEELAAELEVLKKDYAEGALKLMVIHHERINRLSDRIAELAEKLDKGERK